MHASRGEILSPYRLCLCILVELRHPAQGQTWALQASEADALSQFLLRKIHDDSSTHEPTLYEFSIELTKTLGSVGDHLQEALHDRLSGIKNHEDLVNCCNAVWSGDVLAATDSGGSAGVAWDSPFGRYLRHCHLIFEAMSFEATVHMLTNIAGYVEVYYKELANRHDTWGQGLGGDGPSYEGTKQLTSAAQVAAHLQRLLEMGRQMHGVLPAEVLAPELDRVLDLTADVPLVQAVSGQAAAMHKQVDTALHSLHHYHDYLIPALSGPDMDAGQEADARALGLRQALLSLSQLHCEFDHMRHALQALLEAVRVAQSSGSAQSLVQCLMQLCMIMRGCAPFAGDESRTPAALAKGPAAAHHLQLLKLLQRCAQQAEKERLPVFMAYCRMGLVEFAMLHSEQPGGAGPVGIRGADRAPAKAPAPGGSAARPLADGAAEAPAPRAQFSSSASSPSAQAWACASYVKDLSHACNLAAACPPAPPVAASPAGGATPPTYSEVYTLHANVTSDCLLASKRSTAEGLREASGKMHLLRCEAWRMHGCCVLAAVEAATFLSLYSHDASDALFAYAQLALIANDRQGPAAAQLVLKTAEREFPLSTDVCLVMARREVEFWEALRQGATRRARRCAAALCSVSDPSGATDTRLRMQAENLMVVAMSASGQHDEAFRQGVKLLANCMDAGLQVEASAVQLTLARTLLDARQPALALPYALNVLYHSSAMHLDVQTAAACVTLAEVKLALSAAMAAEARAIVQAQLPLIESQASLELQARAHLVIAESFLRVCSPSKLFMARATVELSLEAALKACEASGWFERGKHAASLLALAKRTWKDVQGSTQAAGIALSMQTRMESAQRSVFV